jgi:hypothetical protein
MKTLNMVLLAVMVAVTGYAQEVKETEPPKALVKAKEAYQKELKRVTDPVSRDYLRTLESLKKDMGTKGDTAGMVAVQKEIDEIKEYLKNETMTEDGAEKMMVGTWSIQAVTGHRDTLTFNADHTMRAGNNDHGTWKIKNGKLRATFVAGAYFEALLPVKAKMTVSHSVSGSWTFEKQK